MTQPQAPTLAPSELRKALQAVWDIGDELDSNHARWAALHVAEEMGVEIEAHNRFSEPPRNRNEETIERLERERDDAFAHLGPLDVAWGRAMAVVPPHGTFRVERAGRFGMLPAGTYSAIYFPENDGSDPAGFAGYGPDPITALDGLRARLVLSPDPSR